MVRLAYPSLGTLIGDRFKRAGGAMTLSTAAVTSHLGGTLWRRTRPNSAFEVMLKGTARRQRGSAAWHTTTRTEKFQVALTIRAALRQPGAWNDLFSEAGWRHSWPPTAAVTAGCTAAPHCCSCHPPPLLFVPLTALNLSKTSHNLF